MSGLRPDRRLAPALLVLVALTFWAYWAVAGNGFIDLDDREYVTENPQVRAGLTAAGAAWAFTSVGYASNWHPLTWLSHMLDVELFGLNPAGHHLMSLLLHAASAVVLLLVLRRATGTLWPGAVVAALFAVHPLHVESVAWVAERKDVLSTLLWALTVAAWLRYVRGPAGGRLAVVVLLFALGLMAKPMLVTLPLVLLLLDYWPLGRLRFDGPAGAGGALAGLPWTRLVAEKIPLFAAAALSSAMTLAAQGTAGAIQLMGTAHAELRWSNAFTSYAAYLDKALWPRGLTIFYPLETPPPWQGAAAALLLAGLTVTALLLARRRPSVAVGWLWYLTTLVPVIGLVQVGSQAMADRYMYVPLVGLSMAVVWSLPDGGRTRRRSAAVGVAAVVVIAAAAAMTRSQAAHWRDSVTIFARAVDQAANWLVHKALGDALYGQGRIEQAVDEYRTALATNPSSAEIHTNLANALDDLRRPAEALAHYRQALQVNPAYAPAFGNRGYLFDRLGRVDEAVADYRRALALDPRYVEAHNNLGSALLKTGDVAAARASFEEAVRFRPDFALALANLGLALERLGERTEARSRYGEALRFDPANATARKGLERLSPGALR